MRAWAIGAEGLQAAPGGLIATFCVRREIAAPAEEAALVARVAGGEHNAFRLLLAAHLPAISRYAQRMLGDRDEADDVAQEVFARLWRDARRYRPEVARLSTWLHRIAHNLCVDRLRRSGRELQVAEDDENAAHSVPGPAAARPEVALQRTQDVAMLRRALAALPERQRSALLLTHYQDLSNREVAAILELSVDALESLLARARRSLRRHLEEHHES